MKVCACCNAIAFEDAKQCFVCMHPFKNYQEDGWAGGVSQDNSLQPLTPSSCVSKALGDVDEHMLFDLDDMCEATLGSKAFSAKQLSAESASAGQFVGKHSKLNKLDKPSRSTGANSNCKWDISVAIKQNCVINKSVSDGDFVLIGRSFDNSVVVPDSKVSRHHAQISFRSGEVWVKDVGSKNMTILDGTPVVGSVLAKDGSKLFMGDSVVTLKKV